MDAARDDEVRTQLARIEGMLSATLPHHSARLDEHDRRLDDTDQRLRRQEADVAVLKASTASSIDVAVMGATDARGRDEAKHRTVVFWQAATAVGGLLLVAVTIYAVLK